MRLRRTGFKTRSDAEKWRAEQLSVKNGVTKIALLLPEAIREEVSLALHELQKHNLRWEPGFFTRIVKEEIARLEKPPAPTLRAVANLWLEEKKQRKLKPKTVTDALDCSRPFFATLGELPIDQITTEQISDTLKGFGEISNLRKRNLLVKLKQIFAFAQKRKWIGPSLTDNPTYPIDVPKSSGGNPTPITAAELEKMMETALETEEELGCSTWVILRAFLGIRDGEASKLIVDPTNGLSLEKGFVHIDREIAKRDERTLYFKPDRCPDPNLVTVIPRNIAPLLEHIAKAHPHRFKRGSSIAPSRRHLERFKKLCIAKGVKWKKNFLRAGFASHHCHLYNRQENTAAIMGHSTGVRILNEHYHRFVTYEEAVRYFSIGLQGLPSEPQK